MSKPNHEVKKLVAFPILIEGSKTFAEAPAEIHVVPCGVWDHPAYGLMEITPTNISEFVQNFNAGIRRDLPITAGHDNGMSGGELPAIGWFKELINRGQEGLYAKVEWTDEGKGLLKDGAFKYFSPEFYQQYEDPETRRVYNYVLVGGALTNKPYFKELEAVVMSFSEPSILNQFNDSHKTMDIKTIVAKKASELNAEEKAFLKAHKAELTAEQVTAFAEVVNDPAPAKTAEEIAAEEKATGDTNEAAGLNRDGSAKTPVTASEPKKGIIQMSEVEVTALRAAADKGVQAFAELDKMKVGTLVTGMLFSETNKKGHILPKQKDAVVAFMSELSAKQRDQFVNIVNSIPEVTQIFTEVGDQGGTVSTAKAAIFAEINAKVTELMKTETKLTFSQALAKVNKLNPELAKRYESAQE